MGLEQNLTGDGFFTTTVDNVIAWARKNSVWPMPMGISCCAIEMMAVGGAKYDIARFGSEVMRMTPRQSDCMIVAGTVTYKMAMVVKKIYDQMPEPKWVIAMGACTSSGGMYRSYPVVQGIDQFLPVDIYTAGCPPRPDNLLNALIELQKKIGKTRAKRFHKFTPNRLKNIMEFKELILSKLRDTFPEVSFDSEEFRDELCIRVPNSVIVDVCDFLKSDEELAFNLCEDVTAIDWGTIKNRFTMVYFIFSMKNKFRLKLKADLADGIEKIDTISAVWKSANWAEREVYDMYGIEFNNHPDLRRMYMPESFEYHPLRKEFPVMGIPGSLPLPKK